METKKIDERFSSVEMAKRRCKNVINKVNSIPHYNQITNSCKTTLIRLANSELTFLSRIPDSTTSSSSSSLSINIGHIEAVVHVIQQPLVTGVSRVCKPIPVPFMAENERKRDCFQKGVHVDIVCTFDGRPVWFIVSDRNPKHVSWDGSHGNKGLKARMEQVLIAAESCLVLKPSSIILFFSNGLEDGLRVKLEDKFRASEFKAEFNLMVYDCVEEVEGNWINIIGRSYQGACLLEIKVDGFRDAVPKVDSGVKNSTVRDVGPEVAEEHRKLNLGDTYSALIMKMNTSSLDVKDSRFNPSIDHEDHLINFDTTALIALISGISNGGTEKLLATPEDHLRQRFKINYDFVIAQVMSEIESPIHLELEGVLAEKRGIICESVLTEFKGLVSMCGGPREKLRADQLLNCLLVVPDNPSTRVAGLPTTRKLVLKNKIVFGTGDYYHAPTLTANMGFVRAVSQTGMSLFTIEHRPRALTGD